jgi:hypothetical protein
MIKYATAIGIAMDRIMMGIVRLFSFMSTPKCSAKNGKNDKDAKNHPLGMVHLTFVYQIIFEKLRPAKRGFELTVKDFHHYIKKTNIARSDWITKSGRLIRVA